MQFALSARSIFRELSANDETFRLFCSVAAKGENQGGWENDRIAAKTLDAELAAKIARHGADEHKHGRLFAGLLRRRGLEPIEVPAAADDCMRLERAGIGLSHERLLEDRPLSDAEILKYLIHSRVTEQRAFEEITQQKRVFRGHPELEKPIAAIAADEVDHLAYCHEELLRFEGNGYGALIHQLLREYALVEIRTYRDVVFCGTVDRRIGMPVRNVTSVMFGGDKLDEIYVTSMARVHHPAEHDAFRVEAKPQFLAGSLFRVTGLGIRGVPEPRFAG